MKPYALAISLGDPAGIGAEVTAKALSHRALRGLRCLLVGDPSTLPPALWQRFKRQPWLRTSNAGRIPAGRPSAKSGAVAGLSLQGAHRSVSSGEARALVTAPVSKEALFLAGERAPGQTEILARLNRLGPKDVGMLLVGGSLRVFLATRHCSLRQALQRLKRPLLEQSLALLSRGLQSHFGIRRPRIALAALNPHAGEAGAFGREEISLLRPFVSRHRREKSIQLSGPFPADTVFVHASRGAYDAVLCLYHDQALIPIKLLAFESGVNVTLGLPYIRTSPDHGTACDIAGKGKADPGSMIAAIKLALQLSR